MSGGPPPPPGTPSTGGKGLRPRRGSRDNANQQSNQPPSSSSSSSSSGTRSVSVSVPASPATPSTSTSSSSSSRSSVVPNGTALVSPPSNHHLRYKPLPPSTLPTQTPPVNRSLSSQTVSNRSSSNTGNKLSVPPSSHPSINIPSGSTVTTAPSLLTPTRDRTLPTPKAAPPTPTHHQQYLQQQQQLYQPSTPHSTTHQQHEEHMRRRRMQTNTTESHDNTGQGGNLGNAHESPLSSINHTGVNSQSLSYLGGRSSIDGSVNVTIVSPAVRPVSPSSLADGEAVQHRAVSSSTSSNETAKSRRKGGRHSGSGSGSNSGSNSGSFSHLVSDSLDDGFSLHHTSHLHGSSSSKVNTSSVWFRVRSLLFRVWLSVSVPVMRLIRWRTAHDSKKTDDAEDYQQQQRDKKKSGTAHTGRKAGRCKQVTRLLVYVLLSLLLFSFVCSLFQSDPFSLSDPLHPLVIAVNSLMFGPAPVPVPPLLMSTPYTIISLLHDMDDAYLSGNKANYLFQFNAVRSWLRLLPPSHIFIYMDTQQSCDKLISMIPAFTELRCHPVPCVNEEYNRPRLDCIFNHANENALTDIIAFVNGDIVLHPYLNIVLDSVRKQYGQHFSLVSRRTDTELDSETVDAWFNSLQHVDHTDAIIEYAATKGKLHGEFGIDLFVYTRTLFATLNFPPFLAGVYRWDNWLLTTLILHDSMQVVDATTPFLVIHQQDTTPPTDHSKRVGSAHNDKIVQDLMGKKKYRIGNVNRAQAQTPCCIYASSPHINNANTIVVGRCPDCQFTANLNVSLQVSLAKYAHHSQWVVIIPVTHKNELDVYAATCYYRKLGIQHFFFLALDQTIYTVLQEKKIPVVSSQSPGGDTQSTLTSPTTADALSPGAILIAEHDFLLNVLQLNYHFLYVDVQSLLLTDPTDYLSTLDHEVMVKKQTAGTQVLKTELSSSIFAVRSSDQGQYYWKQVMHCRVTNAAMADTSNWVDCIVTQYTKIGGALKKGILDAFLFPDMHATLVDKWPQLNGYYPLVLVSNSSLNSNAAQRRELLKTWKLTANSPDRPSECMIIHPPLFSPPTATAQTAFSLKIRVLTFDRYESLSRLLTSLNEANYSGDADITLEIAIDAPANMSDVVVVEKNKKTVDTASSFQWRHGPMKLIQQESHKGLVGQWTTGWRPASNTEILLFLEDDTVVSPHYYVWTKKMIQTYYLDPKQYDPRMFGFALQLQHTILGETLKERYGSRKISQLVGNDTMLYRYQLVGTWGGVFFPQHWTEFVTWLREKQFQPSSGTSRLSPPFHPCVPTVLSNEWWANKTHKVWSQWFIRFAYEKGWYNVYANFPAESVDPNTSNLYESNQPSFVGNYREAGDNFNQTKGLMNPLVTQLTDAMMFMPNLDSLPLYDLHFTRVSQPSMLALRNVLYHDSQFPQCWTMKEFIRKKKEKEEMDRIAEDKRKLKEENKRRQNLGLKPLTSLAQMNSNNLPQKNGKTTTDANKQAASIPTEQAQQPQQQQTENQAQPTEAVAEVQTPPAPPPPAAPAVG